MRELPGRDDCDADVLILGGSFLGVELVRSLLRRMGRRALRICVVDRLERHEYVPLCHEILTGRLTREDAVLETAAYVRRHGGEYVVDEIVGLDPETHTVRTASGRVLRGRTIVIALGSNVAAPPTASHASTNVAAPRHLRGLKTAPDVEAVRVALAALAGRASRVAVVGGGISGCELAGELAVLARKQPGLDVVLVHRGARLLEGLHPRVSRAALRRLERQGVTVHLGAGLSVSEDGACGLDVRGALTPLPVDLVVWSGGVAPPDVVAQLPLATDASGWLEVSPSLQCARRDGTPTPGIFAGGDIAQILEGGRPVRAMRRAIEAIVQASRIARNVLAVLEARDASAVSMVPYRPLRDFPHGVSLGARSLLVLGSFAFDLLGFNVWFRRFLMRRYFARYR